ncbi:hypothetical protein L596_015500 [Steinernema carpocapsae]|uniref:RING-type domain-containing protein n=1 Tax=Steinernema carpocapsae TaxID=34508 RepID=A0A4V6XW87_STECR|nr:hypothetical protein L596_015500 [Steinernema carpocapsae]
MVLPRTCGVCWEPKQPAEIQTLACSHSFCCVCLSMCHPDNCPTEGCMGDRKAEFVVDEAEGDGIAGDEGAAVSETVELGPKASAAAIRLEERQRCEVLKGSFQCVNSAGMYLLNCRHRICFDCVGKRVAVAVAAKEHPYCPFPRCANRLTKNDLRLLSCHTHTMKQLCDVLMPKLVDEEDSVFLVGKDDIVVYCSVQGNDLYTRSISYPKNCTIGDMVSSMLQVLQVPKSRTAYNIGVYLKAGSDGGKGGRLEKLDMKTLNKKQIKDVSGVHDKSHIVLDVDNSIQQALNKAMGK